MLVRLFMLYGFLILQQSLAQVAESNPLVQKLHDYSRNRPEEKVFLHFDKPYYVAGETVWFKGYITIGADHFPSAQSELLYVDFYDDKNNFIGQELIHSKNGFGSGYFDIPPELSAYKLRVKAYTNWMRNFNMDYIFQKSLTLIREEEQTDLVSSHETRLDFYPEGGELIGGITNRVALKADLRLAEKTMMLIDNGGEELDEVFIDERGYGQFTIKPDVANRYFLKYQTQRFELPDAQAEGISLTLNSYSYPDFARLTLRKKAGGHPEKVTVLVHTRGTVHHVAELGFSRAAAITNIPKGKLPTGVNHLTIFDESGTPLAERLFYIDRENPVSLDINGLSETVSTREKVSLDLNLSHLRDQTSLVSNLSFTATQRGEINKSPEEENIKTYLLLNSDLRGRILNPGYYFSDDSQDKKQALDRVMMTHGWRRFAWETILSEKQDSIQYEPEKGMILKGKMVGKTNRKPVANGMVTYINKQKGQLIMRNESTDENGEFILRDLIHTSDDKVTLKGVAVLKGLKRARKQFVAFEFDTLTEVIPTPWLIAEEVTAPANSSASKEILSDTEKRDLYDSIYNFDPEVRIVEGVTVQGDKEASETEVSPIYGKGTVTYKVSDEAREQNARDIFSLLQGKVSGLLIIPTMNPATTIVQIRSNVRIGTDQTGRSTADILPPKYVLNDMESDISTLSYIPVSQVDRIEIFKGPDAVAHGLNTIGGVIAVYTKSGFGKTPKEAEAELGLYIMTLPGLQAPREFFSPDYAKDKPEHVKPDIRSLVHWQPKVVTDSTGKAKVEFWTTDNTGTIDIEVQGLTYGGKPVVSKATVEVKGKR